MFRVAWRVQDFAGNSDLCEELATFIERNRDIAILRDVNVVIPRLRPGFHDWNGRNLNVENEKRHAFFLQFLAEASMVDVIVRGECIAKLVKGHIHPL